MSKSQCISYRAFGYSMIRQERCAVLNLRLNILEYIVGKIGKDIVLRCISDLVGLGGLRENNVNCYLKRPTKPQTHSL